MPRQQIFIANYTNPDSYSFGNAYQSALDAGYSESYARNITHLKPEFISEYIGKMELMEVAEKNMSEFLNGKDERYKFLASKFILESFKVKFSEVVKNESAEDTQIVYSWGEPLEPQKHDT